MSNIKMYEEYNSDIIEVDNNEYDYLIKKYKLLEFSKKEKVSISKSSNIRYDFGDKIIVDNILVSKLSDDWYLIFTEKKKFKCDQFDSLLTYLNNS